MKQNCWLFCRFYAVFSVYAIYWLVFLFFVVVVSEEMAEIIIEGCAGGNDEPCDKHSVWLANRIRKAIHMRIMKSWVSGTARKLSFRRNSSAFMQKYANYPVSGGDWYDIFFRCQCQKEVKRKVKLEMGEQKYDCRELAVGGRVRVCHGNETNQRLMQIPNRRFQHGFESIIRAVTSSSASLSTFKEQLEWKQKKKTVHRAYWLVARDQVPQLEGVRTIDEHDQSTFKQCSLEQSTIKLSTFKHEQSTKSVHVFHLHTAKLLIDDSVYCTKYYSV